MVARRVAIIGCCVFLVADGTMQAQRSNRDAHLRIRRVKKEKKGHGTHAGRVVGNVVSDVLVLHKNLLDWDSVKVITATFPLYIAGRMADNDIQNCFYNPCCHKNIHQMSSFCHDFGKYAVSIPFLALGSSIFWSNDEDMRETSRMFLIGMPFLIWGKDLLKHIRFEACKRPWNEHFSSKCRANGGFPSGHMAEMSYATVLYGMRQGVSVGVPLGIVSLFLGIAFVNCNRHYISQLVAGAGLGTMYAIAADKVVSSRLKDDLKLGFSMTKSGGPALQMSYTF